MFGGGVSPSFHSHKPLFVPHPSVDHAPRPLQDKARHVQVLPQSRGGGPRPGKARDWAT